MEVEVEDLELVSECIIKLFEWEGLFPLAFEPDVAGSQCFNIGVFLFRMVIWTDIVSWPLFFL